MGDFAICSGDLVVGGFNVGNNWTVLSAGAKDGTARAVAELSHES
jgi:hypothetical protein